MLEYHFYKAAGFQTFIVQHKSLCYTNDYVLLLQIVEPVDLSEKKLPNLTVVIKVFLNRLICCMILHRAPHKIYCFLKVDTRNIFHKKLLTILPNCAQI